MHSVFDNPRLEETSPVSQLDNSLSDVTIDELLENTLPTNSFAAVDSADQMKLEGAQVAATKTQIDNLLDTDAIKNPEVALATGYVASTAVHQSVMMRIAPGRSVPPEQDPTQYIVGAVIDGDDLELVLGDREPVNLVTGDHFIVPPGVSYSLTNKTQTLTALIKFIITK